MWGSGDVIGHPCWLGSPPQFTLVYSRKRLEHSAEIREIEKQCKEKHPPKLLTDTACPFKYKPHSTMLSLNVTFLRTHPCPWMRFWWHHHLWCCVSTGILTSVCGIGTPFSSRRRPSFPSSFWRGANGLSSAGSLGWGIFAGAVCQC